MSMRPILLAALVAVGFPAVATYAQQQASPNPPAQPERRTTALGTRPQQFYLSKITVSDLPKSYEFYTKGNGLKWATSPGQPPQKAPTAADPEVDFREIPLNFTGSLADPIFVLVKRRDSKPTPEAAKLTTIGFKVPSAREAVARAVAAGYTATGRAPNEGPMTFGFIFDPDGYHIEFVQAPSYPEK